jgi:hypothetical protein
MKKSVVLIALFIAFLSSSHASDIRVGGRAEMFGSLYPSSDPDGVDFRLLPNVSWEQDSWLLYAEMDLRYGSQRYESGVFDFFSQDRQFVSFRELYLRYRGNGWDAKIGQQVIDWSVMEFISPTDSLSPFDFGDFIRWDERRGVSAVDLRFGYSTYLELLFVPRFVPSILPYDPWQPSFPAGITVNAVGALDDSSFGARFGSKVGGFDCGASASYSYSVVPVIGLDIAGGIPTITPRYHREKVFSGWVSGEFLDGSISKLEVAYTDRDAADDFVKIGFSTDYYWNNLLTESDELYVLLQFVIDLKVRNESSFDYLDISRLEGLMWRVKYDFARSDFSTKVEGHYNPFGGDFHIQPSVQWAKGIWSTELGGGVLGGPRDSFWGSPLADYYLFCSLTFHF